MARHAAALEDVVRIGIATDRAGGGDELLTPCVARWPWKWCRFITPAVPRPFGGAITSTAAV